MAMLLNYLNEDIYILLRDLCTPEKLTAKSYKNLCGILSKHFSPQIFMYKKRCNFHAARRDARETAGEWIAIIKKLSMKCEFGTKLEDILADKFIMGYSSGKVAERIYGEAEEITLEKAYGIAIRYGSRDIGRNDEVNAIYMSKQDGGKKKQFAKSSFERRPEKRSGNEKRMQNGVEDREHKKKEEWRIQAHATTFFLLLIV